MRSRLGLWFVAALVSSVGALQAQQPPPVELKNPNVWDHLIGARSEIHLSPEEQEDFRKSRALLGRSYISFKIVVSANGRVESADVVPSTANEKVKDHIEQARAIELGRTFRPWLEAGVPIRVKVEDIVQILPPERWAQTRIAFPALDDAATVQSARITLERTRCYGSCPDYTVTLSGDGVVSFNGRYFVSVPGEHGARIPPEAFHELLLAFRSADFFSALDRYHGNWTDNPTQTLTLSVGGQSKTIVDYVGTDAGLPLAIRNLEGQIDETAGTARWVRAEGDVVTTLKAEKWDFAAPTAENMKLYTTAVERGNRALVDQYLAAHAPVTAPVLTQTSPICAASLRGELDLVRRMTDGRPPLPEEVRNQCLSAAARGGDVGVFQLWLEKGASIVATPEKTKDGGWSNLSLLANALFSGNPIIVRKILDAQVDVKADRPGGDPILRWAIMRGATPHIAEIVTMLAEAGADVNERSVMGQTPIFEVGFNAAAIKPLVAAGANVDARDDRGNTPLMRNAFQEPVVRALLAAGADPAAAAKNGDTPLKIAKQYQCAGCAKLIEEALAKRAVAAASAP